MGFSEEVQAAIAVERQRLFTSRIYKALLDDENASLDLWKVYLWESYHYVKHNGINQALGVLRTEIGRKRLMIEYLKHALEEIDHDEMCLRDLEKLGVGREVVINSRPLPETAAFSSLLYDFVMRDNPFGRLGYSLWAESNGDYAPTVIERLRYHFGLPDAWMTFVVSHSNLDVRHAEHCAKIIDTHALTASDREAILWFAPASLRVFTHALEAWYDRYLEGGLPGYKTAEEALKAAAGKP